MKFIQGENPMSTCLNCRAPALRVGLIATALVLGADASAVAAEECLTAPNRAPGPGGHWYFHLDRNQDRKCWYLVEPASPPRAAEAPPVSPLAPPFAPAAPPVAQPPSPPPSLDSIFSFWSAGFTSTPVPPPPGAANAAVPMARPEDDATRQPRAARRFDVPQAALTPKPRKPPPARAPVAHADDQGAAPLSESQRDALFREFLRWKGQQIPQ